MKGHQDIPWHEWESKESWNENSKKGNLQDLFTTPQETPLF